MAASRWPRGDWGVVLTITQPLAVNWELNDRSDDVIARNYVDEALASIAGDVGARAARGVIGRDASGG